MLVQGVRACACVLAPLSMVCAGDPRRALVLLAHTPTMVYAEEYVPARASERAWCGDRACVQCAPPAGRDRPAAQRPHSRRPNVPGASVHRPWHAPPRQLARFSLPWFVCLSFVWFGMFSGLQSYDLFARLDVHRSARAGRCCATGLRSNHRSTDCQAHRVRTSIK